MTVFYGVIPLRKLIVKYIFEKLRYSLIDLFTDSDAILNFCSVDFCLKWTLYFVSTSNFMKEYQFSPLFDFGKLFNMSVKVYIFMKALTMKKFSYTLGRVRILQHWTKS